jgi:5-methylcytosine-specific restriction endonuclease McrA
VAARQAALESIEAGESQPVPLSALPGRRPPEQRGTTSGRVLVLNASYEPINVCTVRRAAVLVLKSRAEILEHSEWSLHAENLTLPRPVVIRLVTYVKIPRDAHRRKITRRAVFARDLWTCQYCGTKRSSLTVDHVIPRSKGGDSDWGNIVTCCAPCNRRKGDRLPAQVGMNPRRKPKAPNPTVFIHVATPVIPQAWQPYLVAA